MWVGKFRVFYSVRRLDLVCSNGDLKTALPHQKLVAENKQLAGFIGNPTLNKRQKESKNNVTITLCMVLEVVLHFRCPPGSVKGPEVLRHYCESLW